MNRCPITYQLCGEQKYSPEGIKLLSSKFERLLEFPYGKSEQLELALLYSDKLSFSGVQPKLNARISLAEGGFKIVPKKGAFILKPQHDRYVGLPENEDLTMRLAKQVGIETPLHGLLYCRDGTLTYFIKRFDRKKRGEKTSVEDFAQIAGLSRETKYDFSMERIVPLIQQWCTFPLLEKKKLFRLTLFSFLVGNEDLHLKNFSLLRHGDLIKLSPAYDLVNSTLVTQSTEELALPLRGKKSRFVRSDFTEYFAREKLHLPLGDIDEVLQNFASVQEKWKEIIQASFLSSEYKQKYQNLVASRWQRLDCF